MIPRAGAFALGLWLLSECASFAQPFDCSVSPRPRDNFLEARFRMVLPSANEPINSILVFVPGTDGDGRSSVDNPAIRDIAHVCHAAILGCYYRGEGLTYDEVAGGSGRALDQALSSLAAQTGRADLAKAPLLLVGFSQGSIWAFNYVCWHPERVKAFAALRAIFPKMEPQEKSFQVPGLLAAGGNDEPGRIRSIIGTFLKARGHDSKWTLLVERGSGHDIGRSLELTKVLFKAACHPGTDDTACYFDAKGREATSSDSRSKSLCYLPNREAADLWKELHQPVSIGGPQSFPDKPRLGNLISVGYPEAPFKCENGESQVGTIRLSSHIPGIVLSKVDLAGEGFSVQSATMGPLPVEIRISFAPKKMLWGRAKANLTISGSLNGIDAGTVVAALTATVKGSVTSVPSFVYLGVVTLGGDTEKKIVLKTGSAGAHLVDSKVPDEVTTVVEPPDVAGNSTLRIHWAPRKRLGRMEGYVDLAFDAPQKGILRIPIVGFVAPESGLKSTVRGKAQKVGKSGRASVSSIAKSGFRVTEPGLSAILSSRNTNCSGVSSPRSLSMISTISGGNLIVILDSLATRI